MKNKIIIYCFALFFFSLLINGCKKDNYRPPTSFLKGSIQYQGDTLRFSNSNPLKMELWQDGFGKSKPIDVYINETGKFSAVLFDGDYKLNFPRGNYPFIFPSDVENGKDTIFFHLKESLNLDINVTPYFTLENVSFSNDNNSVTANFTIDKIITDSRSKNIDKTFLFLGKTRILDNSNNIAASSIRGKEISDFNNIYIKVKIPDMVPSQNYVFARVGIKIASIERMIFSSVVKINFE